MFKRLLVLVAIIFSGTVFQSKAQCIPDITITDPGIYPDSATGLPSGIVGVPYNEVIQVRVLTDTTLNSLPVVITNITITTVTGLPPGLTYSCNPSSCVFPGGSNGCILLSGTPSTAGVYPLTVDVSVAGTIFGIPAPPQISSIDYYVITIDATSGIETNIAALKFDLLQNKPNPAITYTDVSFTSPVAGDFYLKVFNLIGKEIYNQTMRGRAGMNTMRVETENLSPGVYMISLENGSEIVTSRMVVSRK
ncbi:MAG: T9SS type A sorting domain-containing protein [Bacteroidota bacterium]|nr:T9SS type A sorting domain-containing protein [Bacteroidota bacterium]